VVQGSQSPQRAAELMMMMMMMTTKWFTIQTTMTHLYRIILYMSGCPGDNSLYSGAQDIQRNYGIYPVLHTKLCITSNSLSIKHQITCSSQVTPQLLVLTMEFTSCHPFGA
jgi:hypothetical protein